MQFDYNMRANVQKENNITFLNIDPKSLLKYKPNDKWFITIIMRKNPNPTWKLDKYFIEIHSKNIYFKKRFWVWKYITNFFR